MGSMWTVERTMHNEQREILHELMKSDDEEDTHPGNCGRSEQGGRRSEPVQ